MSENKKHINVVAIGLVDSGKSTTLDRLMYECGNVDQDKFDDIENQASEIGKESFKYAWIFDKLRAERDRGITIDISHEKLETSKYIINLIDVPGHPDFTKNMLTGTAQADCAIVVVSADDDDLDANISENGRIKEQLYAARNLGVQDIIIAINKMDSIDWSQDRFDYVSANIQEIFKKVGYKLPDVPIVPISGWDGDNLVYSSTNCPWYEGWTKSNIRNSYSGKTLLEAIDAFRAPARPSDFPLRIPIERVYNISGIGTVPVGSIACGVIKPGMSVTFAPTTLTSEVKSVERYHESLSEAGSRDSVGFNVGNVDAYKIKPGYVAGEFDIEEGMFTESFVAQIVIINHPGTIVSGYTPILDCHTTHVACRFVEFIEKLDRRTGNVIGINPKSLKQGDSAMVTVFPSKPIYIEPLAKNPSLARFVIRDNGKIVGMGVAKTVRRTKIFKPLF